MQENKIKPPIKVSDNDQPNEQQEQFLIDGLHPIQILIQVAGLACSRGALNLTEAKFAAMAVEYFTPAQVKKG